MRTTLVRLAAWSATAVLLASCGSEQPERASAPSAHAHPIATVDNIVIVCLDTLRHDAFYLADKAGFSDALTPWIDQAVHFDQASSTAPWTVPAIASVLTGLYPNQHGAGMFPGAVANLSTEIPTPLPEETPSLAERLAELEGLDSAAYVAHPWFASGYGLERGFERMGMRRGSDKIVELATEWLDGSITPRKPRPVDRRFLLYLHFMEAHDWHLTEGQALRDHAQALPEGLLQAALDSAPANICDKQTSRMCRKYLAYINAIHVERESLGQFLNNLAALGADANTAVLVFSDHGEEFHDHLEEAKAAQIDPRGIHGFGHGQSLHQELLHVPLLVWHPGLPAQRIDTPVSLVDVAPTLLQWMGLDLSATGWSGTLLTDAIGGRQTSTITDPAFQPDWSGERHLYASGIAYGPQQIATRAGQMKAIWHQRNEQIELFDLTTDPLEKSPLDNPELVLRFDPLLGDYAEITPAAMAEAPELDAEQIEHLKSIGYLQGVEEDGQ